MKTVHFTVDFGFLTEKIRDFWAEGEYPRAIKLIESCNIPIEKGYDLIRGKLKMVQAPKGKMGVEGTLVVDNWKPDLDRCHHGKYPDPTELPSMAAKFIDKEYQYTELKNHILQDNFNKLLGELDYAYKQWDMESAHDIWQLIDEFPGFVEEKKNINWSRKICEDTVAGRNVHNKNYGLTKGGEEFAKNYRAEKLGVDQYIEDVRDRDNRQAPKPTKDFVKYKQGWVLPNGKFYPCLTSMEHIWLAEKLGKDDKTAMELGWGKVSYALLGIYISFQKRPTQKQLDTIFDWYQADPKERESAYTEFMKFNKDVFDM